MKSAYSVFTTFFRKGPSMIFKPTIWVKNVLSIDAELLEKHRIKALVLDLDNTLSMHGSPAAEEGVFEWLEEMRRLDIKMAVVSNNTQKRVAPLAAKLGLDFTSFACKPMTFGLTRAVKKLGFSKKETAVVGDQIFTDIMGGNLKGMPTVLVEPFHLEHGFFFKLKRKAENVVFNRKKSQFYK